MNWMLKLSFILILLCLLLVPCKHILHMFQQNRYETGRLSKWLKDQGKQKKIPWLSFLFFILFVALIFVTDEKIRLLMTIWVAVVYAALSMFLESKKAKKYIQPLNWTWRVKRQMLTLFLLNLCWIGCFVVVLPSAYWNFIAASALFINWGLVYVMAWITTPIENAVKKHFMNIAKKILQNHRAKIIGITGSYGKTSCKNILQEVLSEQFYSLMTPASFNTPMGITITIREHLKPLHEVFICEMGADHVGDIEHLMNFVHPQVGVVTSIGPQHLQTFKSLENIIHEKMQMIEMLPTNGMGVLNKDNENIRNYQIKNTCKILWYGIEQEDVDYRAIEISYSKHGSRFTVLDRDGIKTEFETRLLGEHNIANILAAIALGKQMGISYSQLQDAVKKVQFVEHRLQLKKINGYTFIDDAFNSNPVGSAMSLEVLKMMDGKRFIVTPGMIDLGEQQSAANKAFGMKMKGKADVVILVGVNQTKPIMEGLQESGFDMSQVYVCKTVKEAFDLVYQQATLQDTILLENDLPDAFNQ